MKYYMHSCRLTDPLRTWKNQVLFIHCLFVPVIDGCNLVTLGRDCLLREASNFKRVPKLTIKVCVHRVWCVFTNSHYSLRAKNPRFHVHTKAWILQDTTVLYSISQLLYVMLCR